MLNGFKKFVMRGNVIDLAVAVVMGGAFGAVVTALVKDLLTPIIAAVVGKPDFSGIVFTINGSKFPIGDFRSEGRRFWSGSDGVGEGSPHADHRGRGGQAGLLRDCLHH